MQLQNFNINIVYHLEAHCLICSVGPVLMKGQISSLRVCKQHFGISFDKYFDQTFS